MSQASIENIKRIVVRGTNWVGDSVMTVPALRALRRLMPEAKITLAIRPSAKGLFAGADFVDDLLIYDRKGFSSLVGQTREWRRRRFDLAVLLQNAFEAAFIPFAAGVPFRLGYATEGRQLLLTNPVPLPEWRATKHEVFYYLYLIAALEQTLLGTHSVCDDEPDVALHLTEAGKADAFALLRSNGVRENRSLVAICPGSINSRAKRWPAERYATLADRLIEESHAEVLLIGSQEESDVSDAVTTQMRKKPIVLTGKTSVAQVSAILGLVDLLVTNDTGPAHIAAALGSPTLVIFGPTNPLTTRPFSSVAEILRHPPDCAPCMLRDCPIDHRCMTAVTVEEVFEKAMVLINRRKIATNARDLCDFVA
jgi:heptosyltransferase-2